MTKDQINEYAAAYVATMVDGKATDASTEYVTANPVADEEAQAKIMEAIDALVNPVVAEEAPVEV